ncbi:MAG TPA: DUF2269 family protein [Steroidobacteraceae bacterium]|nr:DUF2269 family protein [Steroidobacteraceae bacterium]
MVYLALKSLHIVSVVLFLGNIITGVFWKFHADRSSELRARAQALDGIIASDRWFTVPGVILIIATGVTLAVLMDYPLLRTKWIGWSLALFGISGAAFSIFVAPLQKKLLANVRAGLAGTWNEAEYHSLSRRWEIWGMVATLAPIGALFLMVFKPV